MFISVALYDLLSNLQHLISISIYFTSLATLFPTAMPTVCVTCVVSLLSCPCNHSQQLINIQVEHIIQFCRTKTNVREKRKSDVLLHSIKRGILYESGKQVGIKIPASL